jgi:MFS transporter, ACS family, D-galactonate transporter
MSDSRPTRVRYLVLFGLCLAAGLAYVHRGCFGVAESTIRTNLDLTEKQTGLAMSLFFWTYALFQIPTGLLITRWGPRKSLLLFGMMCAFTLAIGAGTMLVGLIFAFPLLIISRALMGVAQAGLFPAATQCFQVWFPTTQRGFATGTLQACMSCGSALGSYVTAQLLVLVSWPWMFLILAIPGVLWSLWFFWFYRDNPQDHPSVNQAEIELQNQGKVIRKTDENAPTPWGKLLTSSKLWLICSQQFFRACATVFWITWCPTYLQNAFGLDKVQAGRLTSIPIVGLILGSFSGGLIADWIYRRTGSKSLSRRGTAIVASSIGVTIFYLAYQLPDRPIVFTNEVKTEPREIPNSAYETVVLLFFAAIFSGMPNACAYSTTIDTGGKQLPIVFGAMNMMGNFGSALFPLLVPQWTSLWNWGSLPLLMGGLYFMSMFFWIFIDPNGTVVEEK